MWERSLRSTRIGTKQLSPKLEVRKEKMEEIIPLRSPDKPSTVTFDPARAPSPPLAVIVLTRMGYGQTKDAIAAFNALGSTDEERLAAYVEQQLNPDPNDDPLIDIWYDFAGFTAVDLLLETLWRDYVRNYEGANSVTRPMIEMRRLRMLRAIYSKWQLQEVMVEFWFDHFSVGVMNIVHALLPSYERDVLRANALGNFRTMLGAVARHPAMLYYLDNFASSNAGPNENFARELFELHTMGAEHYLGADMRQFDVPGFPAEPAGYVDDDVYEAAFCFTGWTIRNNAGEPTIGDTGQFFYREEWHDQSQKTVLGNFIPRDQPPLKDGEDVMDALCNHIGTARHICRKLVQRLVSDNPPEALVESAAQVWHQWINANDQITRVLRHILTSPQFATTYGEKVKRPFEAVVGAVRAMGTFPISMNEPRTDSLLTIYKDTGQQLYTWPTPDGFPDKAEHWLNAKTLFALWRTYNWVSVTRYVNDSDRYVIDLVGQLPNEPLTPRQMVDFWLDRLLGHTIPDDDYAELLDYIAQGRNPDFILPYPYDNQTQELIRSFVALTFCSPSYIYR